MATRLATATATTTKWAGANGLLHLHAVADHALADTHALADNQRTQIRRQTCLDHGLVKMTKPRRSEQNKPNALDSKSLRQAPRPRRVLRARPAGKQQPRQKGQKEVRVRVLRALPAPKDGQERVPDDFDARFATTTRFDVRFATTTRPTGHPSTLGPPFAHFAEEARQQEGAS